LGLATAADNRGQRLCAPEPLRFSATSYIVSETGTNAVITVVRTNGSAGVVSVDYATSGGTATPSQDYGPSIGTVAFADGQTSSSFLIRLSRDTLVEQNETVLLRLFNPQGGARAEQSEQRGVDDPQRRGVPLPGELDATFDPGAGAMVSCTWWRCSRMERFWPAARSRVLTAPIETASPRLNEDGAFAGPWLQPGSGANGLVWTLALQADGKVLLGGAFTSVNGIGRVRIARLNPNGSVDGGFQLASGVNATVYAIAVQADDRILIGRFIQQSERNEPRPA